MKSYTHILTGRSGRNGIITFNRPSVHNAMNIEMIREFKDAFSTFDSDEDITVITIQSNGKNFSSGADLEWMKSGMNQSEAELASESAELALLFHDIYNSQKIIITLVRGKAMGGANGIIAASDIVVASDNSAFAFSEVKIGLIPATISPFVVKKVGASVASEWMITGRLFNAIEAYRRGYVHHVVDDEKLAEEAAEIVGKILQNSPDALTGVKELIRMIELEKDHRKLLKPTAELIAKFRVSAEGQEGIRAFFEKRQPNWIDEK